LWIKKCKFKKKLKIPDFLNFLEKKSQFPQFYIPKDLKMLKNINRTIYGFKFANNWLKNQ